ncbi:2-arachidonoylglycerol hydrolase ABHD12 [Aphelenchoides fujianensis]|nr:2-arachidonoylglycerol hydrolase ABHD12 [Aphelenchoides fujianensis]
MSAQRRDARSPGLATARCACGSPRGAPTAESCPPAAADDPLDTPLTARPLEARIVATPRASQLAESRFWPLFFRAYDRLHAVTLLEVAAGVAGSVLATMLVLHFCVRADDGRPQADDSALLAFKRSYQRRLHSSAAQLLRAFVRSVLVLAGTLVVVYVVLPLGFFLFPAHAQHVFFLNFMRAVGINYADLRAHGIRSPGRNFYLQGRFAEDEAEQPILGCWHVLPARLAARLPAAPSDAQIAELLAASEEPVVVYCHGNSYDRTSRHRCQLYQAALLFRPVLHSSSLQTLSEQNFHVISFDYRGYGDSTGLPTEDGVVRDAITVFDHVRAQCPGRRIVLWGHSMGSGVAVRVAAELCAQRTPPHCLVLESAFNNLRDAMHAHPYSLPYRRFPLFELAVVRPLMRAGLVMCSEDRIKKVTCPILMLHAADDVIIPLRLGRLLYDARCRSNPLVQFVEFEPHRGLGHNSIYRALELATILTHALLVF